VEGTCDTTLRDVKCIRVYGMMAGKSSRGRSSGRCVDNTLILPEQNVSGLV
jgi:hypothetical protein